MRHRYTVLYATEYQDSYDGLFTGSRQVLAVTPFGAWVKVRNALDTEEPGNEHACVAVIAGWNKVLYS